MRIRAVRVMLFLLMVSAFGAATVEVLSIEKQANGLRAAQGAFDRAAEHVQALLDELRAAEYASVARGQGARFWTARAAGLLDSAQEELQALVPAATASDASSALRNAVDALSSFTRIDARVQADLRSDQVLPASDLIFRDLNDALDGVSQPIGDARRMESVAAQADGDRARRLQAMTAAGAAAFSLLVSMMLLPGGRRAEAPTSEDAPAVPAGATGPMHGVRPADGPGTRVEAMSQDIDLEKIAALCTDFARAGETSSLPSLLERAATLLDASGVIVWIDDPKKGELLPALAYGYTPQALARIGAISRDDDNATAQAFRERNLRCVGPAGESGGAIAAPLLTPEGCAGVMAAELKRRPGGRGRDVNSVALILAAQLSTLIAPQGSGEPAAPPGTAR